LFTLLAIGISPVPYSYNINQMLGVSDLVNNPVFANPNTPEILSALNFAAATWAGMAGKSLDFLEDTLCQFRFKCL
jgi:hypothetical protein